MLEKYFVLYLKLWLGYCILFRCYKILVLCGSVVENIIYCIHMSWRCPKWWQRIPFLGNGVGGRIATAPHYNIECPSRGLWLLGHFAQNFLRLGEGKLSWNSQDDLGKLQKILFMFWQDGLFPNVRHHLLCQSWLPGQAKPAVRKSHVSDLSFTVQGLLLAVVYFENRWLQMEYIVWQCNVRELVYSHHICVPTAHFVLSTIHTSLCP